MNNNAQANTERDHIEEKERVGVEIMNIFKRNNSDKLLKEQINSVLNSMSGSPPDSEEYAKMAKNLETLYSIKNKDQNKRLSPDTLAVVLANLLGIAMILGYEKANAITSKALGFVMRGRV
jgi:20S proteasome alpha/beta subunit